MLLAINVSRNYNRPEMFDRITKSDIVRISVSIFGINVDYYELFLVFCNLLNDSLEHWLIVEAANLHIISSHIGVSRSLSNNILIFDNNESARFSYKPHIIIETLRRRSLLWILLTSLLEWYLNQCPSHLATIPLDIKLYFLGCCC